MLDHEGTHGESSRPSQSLHHPVTADLNSQLIYTGTFLDPEVGSQKATLVAVVLVVVGISSPGSRNP